MNRSFTRWSLVMGGLVGLSFTLFNGTWGCGSTRAATSTAETVTITGTVSGASSTSASLSALGIKRAISEAPVADDACTLYDAHGTEVGTFTTDAAGAYSVAVTESLLNPDAAESVTVNLILDCASGYASFAEATIDSSTSSVTVNADPESTLAVEALKNKMLELGCTGWAGCDFDAVGVDFDAFCFCQLEQKKWELASAEGSGLGLQLGAMKEMMLVSLAGGDLGSYGSPSAMMQAFLNGSVDSTFQATAASAAATATGIDSATYTDNIDDALSGIGSFLGVMNGQIAGGTGAGVTALRTKGAVDATDESLCGAALADEDALEQIVATLLAAESFDECANTFTAAGVSSFFDVFANFQGEDGDFNFDAGWNPAGMMGYMAGFQGEFDGFDPTAAWETLEQLPTGEDFDYRSWGAAMAGDFRDTCGTAAGDCSFDPSARAGFWSTQVAAGTEFDPSSETYGTYGFGDFYEQNYDPNTDYGPCQTDPDSAECQSVTATPVASGGSCTATSQCQSGLTCTSGTCQASFTPVTRNYTTRVGGSDTCDAAPAALTQTSATAGTVAFPGGVTGTATISGGSASLIVDLGGGFTLNCASGPYSATVLGPLTCTGGINCTLHVTP